MEFGNKLPQRFSDQAEHWTPSAAPAVQQPSELVADTAAQADSEVSIRATLRSNLDPLSHMRLIRSDWGIVLDQSGDDAILAELESQAEALEAAHPNITREEWDTGQFKKIQ